VTNSASGVIHGWCLSLPGRYQQDAASSLYIQGIPSHGPNAARLQTSINGGISVKTEVTSCSTEGDRHSILIDLREVVHFEIDGDNLSASPSSRQSPLTAGYYCDLGRPQRH
jgi:hypothetical protein